jgi:hypothetical protein
VTKKRNAALATVSLLAGLAIMAAGVVPAVQESRRAAAERDPGHVVAPTSAERSAGCTGVRTEAVAGASAHRFGRISYGAAPPTSGQHNPDPLPDTRRFFARAEAPAPERAVHNLEHGYVVVWFDERLPATGVRRLKDAVTKVPRALAVAWTRGDLAGGPLALSSWGRVEFCRSVDVEVIRAFVRRYGDRSPEPRGQGGSGAAASEVGVSQ